MLLKDVPIEEVNRILYGEDKTDENEKDSPRKQNERLLKQKKLKSFKLEPIPYYKKPLVQITFVGLCGFPLIWMLMSAFTNGSSPKTEKVESLEEKEKEELKTSLDEAQRRIQELTIAQALQTQETEVVLPEETEEEGEKDETAEMPKVVKSSAPQPVAQQVVYRRTTNERPKVTPRRVEPEVIEEKEPEIDPMEEWLAQTQRSYSVSSRLQAAKNREQSNPLVSLKPPDRVKVASNIEVGIEDRVTEPQMEVATRPINKQIELLDNNYLRKATREKTLWSDRELRSRLELGEQVEAPEVKLVAIDPSKLVTQNGELILRKEAKVKEAVQREIKPGNSKDINNLLDIGSFGLATFSEGIAWSEASSLNNRKYVLHLKEGFKNSADIEVLPKGTRLIAKITQIGRTGLFSMEVTQIISNLEEPIISVPSGTLEVIAKDGLPLRAKLKQTGSSDTLSNLGAIVAPGIEEAFDSLADSADSLLLNDGDRSIVRSDGRRNPLASGLSGVANGASEVLKAQIDSRNNQSNSRISYFQFEGGQTVQIVVNENFEISHE